MTLIWRSRITLPALKEIFTGYYKTPANQPDLDLRFSNVIADLMTPQRALLGGWAMGIPTLYLLISSVREKSYRQTALLALWAAALPLVHTHTFLALALFSGGYLLGSLIEHREDRCGILLRAGLYLAVVLALALPQLRGQRRPADAGGRRAAVPVQLGQQQRRARPQGRLFLVLGEKRGSAVHSRRFARACAPESGGIWISCWA